MPKYHLINFHMKKLPILIPFFFAFALMLVSCKKETTIEETPVLSELTTAELEMMHYMMEEEKLAYDVYVTLYNNYNAAIFNNISKSEQSHMDAVSKLLEKYGIENTASTTLGVFNDAHLQELYNSLVAAGNVSLVEALKVGATIEDVDIYDLEDYMALTDNVDILSVFDFLDCGSRNHLRGFVNQLDLQSAVYTPQFISEAHYLEIIESDHEACTSYTLD